MKQLPPPLVNFTDLSELEIALSGHAPASELQEIGNLIHLKLPPATSATTLGTLFGLRPAFIVSLMVNSNHYYRTFTIRKGSKLREIQAPTVALKIIQRWFAGHLSRNISLPSYVCGFIPGKNGVKEAAKFHCNAKCVYSLDIENFFPSITIDKVISALTKIGYSEKTAIFLSNLTTLDRKLPQGSPASPVLSNLAFECTDNKIHRLTERLGIKYTRYADDMVFSSTRELSQEIRNSIKDIVTNDGWNLSARKEYYSFSPGQLKVHNLLVHGNTVRLTKSDRNRNRTYRHLIKNNRVINSDLAKINGYLNYQSFIEGD